MPYCKLSVHLYSCPLQQFGLHVLVHRDKERQPQASCGQAPTPTAHANRLLAREDTVSGRIPNILSQKRPTNPC
jgi:hypothetical protein